MVWREIHQEPISGEWQKHFLIQDMMYSPGTTGAVAMK